VLPCEEQPLYLRGPIIEILGGKPDTPLTDVLWAGALVASPVYLRQVFPAGKRIPASEHQLLGLGLAAIAGSVPELLTSLGYNPLLLSRVAFFLMRAWKRLDWARMPSSEQEWRQASLRGMNERTSAELVRAYAGFRMWHAEAGEGFTRADPANPQFSLYQQLESALGRSRHATPEQNLASIKKVAKARGDLDSLENPESGIGALLVRYAEAHRDKRILPVFIGNDGLLHADSTAIVDANRAGVRRRRRKAPPDLSLDDETAGQAQDAASPDPLNDPALAAEARDYLNQVERVIQLSTRDDVDRQDLALLFDGERNRSERARQVGVSESTLRKRELRLAQHACIAARSEGVREGIRRLLAG
jgi:hypothetical protein